MEPDVQQRRADFEKFGGRLWEDPLASLKPLARPVSWFWDRAPAWLVERARRPFTEIQAGLWEALRDPDRIGTEVLARVPIWIPQYEVGYVLDFLIPEYSVNLQIDEWREEFLADEAPEFDFEAEPDHPENFGRSEDLRQAFGIEPISYYDTTVRDWGVEVTIEEVRRDLGFGRPAWMQRMPSSKPCHLPPAAPG